MRIRSLDLCRQSLRLHLRSHPNNGARTVLGVVLLGMLIVAHGKASAFNAPGLMLFEAVIWINFLVISAFGVSTFASVITEEKEQMTLGLLKLAGFAPGAILLGKSLGLLVNGLILIAVQFPFVLLSITLGGVSFEQLSAAYTLLPAYTLFVYALALFWSVVCATTGRAALLTTLALVCFLLLPTVCALLQSAFPVPWLTRLTKLAFVASAPVSLWYTGTPFFSRTVPWEAVLAHLGLAVVLFALSWLLFERITRNERPAAAPRGLLDWLPWRKSRGATGRAWTQALVWKDFWFACGGLVNLIGRCVLIALLALALAELVYQDASGRLQKQQYAGALFGWGLLLVIVEAAWVASRFLSAERKWQTLAALVMLPVPTSRVVYQKLCGHLVHLLPSAALVVAGAAMLITSSSSGPDWEEVLYFVGSVCLALHLIAYLSLVVRRGAFAIVLCGYVAWSFVMVVGMGFGRLWFSVSADAMFAVLGVTALVASAVLHPIIGARWRRLAAS